MTRMLPGALALLIVLAAGRASAQDPSPVGRWRAMDHDNRRVAAIIELFEEDGRLHGRIEKLLLDPPETTCARCPGDLKGKRVQGMVVLWDLQRVGEEWVGGRVLDPTSGNIYRARLRVRDDGTVELRGFLGVSLLGRTQILSPAAPAPRQQTLSASERG